MNKEELEEIKNILNNNKDYKEHHHLNDYFEVEYINNLVNSYEKLQQEKQDLIKYLEDKIKECDTYQGEDEICNLYLLNKKTAYQEILDKIKGE